MTIKKKIIIFTSFVTIIIAVIVYAIILPTINDIKNISKSVYQERADLEKKYLRGQILRNTIENFEKIKPEKVRLISIFIIENQELEFITELENIAAANHIEQQLNFQSNKNEGEKSEKGFYSLPLEIKVQANFLETMRYLEDLEKMNYYYNIESVTIDTAGQNSDMIRLSLTGNVYMLPAENNS